MPKPIPHDPSLCVPSPRLPTAILQPPAAAGGASLYPALARAALQPFRFLLNQVWLGVNPMAELLGLPAAAPAPPDAPLDAPPDAHCLAARGRPGDDADLAFIARITAEIIAEIIATFIAAPLARMAPYRNAATQDPIVDRWQSHLQYAVEAGIAPHIALGLSADALTACIGLAALQLLIETRSDMSAPLITVGGASGAWLDALMLPQNGVAARSPSAQTLFMGVDPASALASAATLSRPPLGLRHPADRALPVGYRAAIAPVLQPASPFTWESLPLRALEPVGGLTGVNPHGSWFGWLGLILALALVVGALVSP